MLFGKFKKQEGNQEAVASPEAILENKKEYMLESGAKVSLEWKISNPEQSLEKDPHKAVIFLPGWGVRANDASVRGLSDAFAEDIQAYTITSLSKYKDFNVTGDIKEKPDLLYEEAKAIAQFIKEKGLTEVTLAGHSRGGNKAINLTQILQQDKDLAVKGLILMDAVGLYEQTSTELVTNFIVDGAKTFIKSPSAIRKANQTTIDIIKTIGKQIGEDGLSYPKEFANQVADMAHSNVRMADIEVPVIIISGTKDLVSQPDKIVDKEEVDDIVRRRTEGAFVGEKLSSRGEVLKNSLFKKSPYVVMLAPEKLGHHGLPIYRADQMAHVSLKLVNRANRNLESVASTQEESQTGIQQ